MARADRRALFTFEHVTVADSDGTLGRPRLDDLCGWIPANGLTAVLGPSGSGKSTLLRLCNRLERPDEGRVLYGEDDVQDLPAGRLRRAVAMLFQQTTPFPGTIADNLRVADPALSDAAVEELLELVTLPAGYRERVADQLSGGERQRLGVARALATRPEVLLADEPTSALDEEARDHVEDVMRDLLARGMPVIWVTHDLAQARRLASSVLHLHEGRLTAQEEIG